MVYSTWQGMKCSGRFVRLLSLQGNASTRQSMYVASRGKATRNYDGVEEVNCVKIGLSWNDCPCWI